MIRTTFVSKTRLDIQRRLLNASRASFGNKATKLDISIDLLHVSVRSIERESRKKRREEIYMPFGRVLSMPPRYHRASLGDERVRGRDSRMTYQSCVFTRTFVLTFLRPQQSMAAALQLRRADDER